MTIPASAQRVVVLEQFAHLDWDWLNFFPYNVDESGVACNSGYFVPSWVKPAATIYRMAGNLLQSFAEEAYSTCEIGFLRAFAETFPDEFRQMVASGRLTIVGGAVTSPDNLLPPGEAFFRAFLTGLNWMDQQALPWSGMVWIPDDFGHDSQLPVMLAAIGAEGVGFARVPGAYRQNLTPAQPEPMASDILKQPVTGVGGLDFWWKADDGSATFAHWMPNGYSQGSGLSGPSSISQYLSENGTGSPSRYVHVPVGNDFMPPMGGEVPPAPPSREVLQWVDEWNRTHPDDYAILASFADYVHWVKQDVASGAVTLKTRTFHGDGRNAETTMFRSNPYFMGFYASRMELKRLHHEAVRLLIGAEALDAASAAAGIGTADDRVERFAAAWNDLAPSTHHDYITGTATDCVYKGEQLPLLRSVVEQAASLFEDTVAGIVTNLGSPSPGVAVLNTLGFERAGVIRMPDGGLVWGSAQALGWNIVSGATPPNVAPVRLTQEPGAVTFDNGLFRCTIRKDANWGITSLSSNSWPAILGGTGNTLSLWQDYGSIYSFGYECQNSAFSNKPFTQTAGDVVVQSNDLRATVSAKLTLTVDQAQYPYTLQYSVAAGQRYVEISITGAAPANTSVFVNFPLPATITKIEHGTPYHWDWKTPATFGDGAFKQVFEPTHDFVLPYAGDRILAAVLHGGVPAWAIDGSTLTGCVLRNTPGEGCDPRGAGGSDPDVHTVTFAFRVPDGLTPAATGLPLREARAYTNPLVGRSVAPGAGRGPLSFVLAATATDDNALLTAAKRGSADPSAIYLRVYKPGNDVQTLTVSTVTLPTSITGATALERRLTPEEEAALGITFRSPFISFTAAHAVTTLKLSGM